MSKPDSGLRDIILEVISLLKKEDSSRTYAQNKKIVVNDENCKKSTWESYSNMIQKKVPEKSLVLVSVYPKYGINQLYWARQYYLLEDSEPVSDGQLSKWFDGGTDISYNKVDDPSSLVGLERIVHEYPLVLHAEFKPDIPALFLQWEAVFCEGTIKAGVIKTCQLWSQQCQHGRVIILLNLIKQASNVESKFQDEIRKNMKTFVSKLGCPAYLYCIDKEAVKFSIPPNAGVLATIQKSHGIGINNQKTVLLYHDQVFSKMAESAGLQYVNATKILQKPSLILNRMMFTSPHKPPFIHDIEVRITEDRPLCLPLYELKFNGQDYIQHYVCLGTQGFLFGDDLLDSFQKRFEEYINNSKDLPGELQKVVTTQISSDEEVIIQNKSVTRELPKWMLGTSKSSSASLSSHRSDSVGSTSSTTGSKTRSTVYIMSEQELVEVATEILKQAGREDILKNVQKKQESTMNISHMTPNTATITDKSDPICIGASNRKRRNIRNKIADTKSSCIKTKEIPSLDFMDTEGSDNIKHESKYQRNVGYGDIDQTIEFQECCQVKVRRTVKSPYKSEQETVELSTCIVDSVIETSQKPDSTSVLTKLRKNRTEENKLSEQTNCYLDCQSSTEPSFNVDPTELFKNMPDTTCDDIKSKPDNLRKTSKQRFIRSIETTRHQDNFTTNDEQGHSTKKPDLSFLDDIFG